MKVTPGCIPTFLVVSVMKWMAIFRRPPGILWWGWILVFKMNQFLIIGVAQSGTDGGVFVAQSRSCATYFITLQF